ncbi:substrate-binding domain-containing protein [Sphingomonas bacterium]|uniref:PstS family phosphate ABC transporter substrate-binding protein n=1 Tax=Sphingomonas bacterium TaxID=1895847 RepID=UPI002612087E|nr:substrate-binding domain-containing protein [Sphingomonas bacterium]MDB5679502.1 phosphate-binding protein [Sphingomonas bacterium]
MKRVILTALLVLCAGAAVAQDDKQPTKETYDQILARLGDGMLENIVIRGEHAARTDARAHKRFYTDLSPLADLPAYQPKVQVSGTIRISGLYLHDGLIAAQWIKDFERFQPGAKVVISQHGTIASSAVDIETGPRISDRLRSVSEYEQTTRERLFEIDWATGSYDVPGWSPGFVIFVNKDNPIAHLTLAQLDGIFAGARTGGWNGTRWNPAAARGPEKNIRTWGQLGLKGAWANKPIHIYGRPLKYNIQLGFERKVFAGGDVWNENTREYSHEMNPDGTRYTSSVEMVKDMAADPYGIVFSDMGSAIPAVRAVPLGATAKGPFVPISLTSLRDRSYPLFIEEWAEARLAPGQKLAPLVKEFLTFMLSREGQDAIQRDGKWIPIPAARARAMIAKLDQAGERVDPRELGLQLSQLAPKKWESESPDETGRIVATRPYYARRFDLSALPAYTPGAQLDGTIRMPASGQLMESTIGKALIAAFAKYQPGIGFALKDGDLNNAEVDLSMGRRWSSYFAGEFLDFQLKHNRSPREIQIATGSFDVPGWSPAFGILVNRENPIKGLTIRQLDDIFGGPRRGGWVSTTWRRQAGRGADENIRRWEQLGLASLCPGNAIDVFVPPLKYNVMSVFERKVLVGGNMWNDGAREVPLMLKPDGSRSMPSADRAALVGRDRCGITFASAGFATPATRLVPIAAQAGGPYVLPTLETVRDRSYPLFLELFAYADQQPGEPMDPKLKEFLRFVLSREGQDIIQRDGKWLPLTAAVAATERAKLDAVIPQVVAPKVEKNK